MNKSTARLGEKIGMIRTIRIFAVVAGCIILLILGVNHALQSDSHPMKRLRSEPSSEGLHPARITLVTEPTLPLLRFTRSRIANTESDEKKDGVVTSELGPNYRAATLLDVLAYSKRVYFSEVPAFGVARSKHRWYCNAPSDAGNPVQFTRTDEPADLPLAAIHVGAPFQFTRGTAEAGTSDAAKDKVVVAELGHGFQAATLLDLLGLMENNVALFESDFVLAGSRFSWRGNNPLLAGRPVIVANSGQLVAPVAAVATGVQRSK